MEESGVDLGFDIMQLIEDDLSNMDDFDFGEIRSKPIAEPPPPKEVKHAFTPMRTDLRMELQRQRALEEEKQKQQQQKQQQLQQQQAMQLSQSVPSSTVQVPHAPVSSEVPQTLLKVSSKLSFPTKYHIQQTQKQKVHEYILTNDMGKTVPNTTNSQPNVLTVQSSAPSVGYAHYGSAPTQQPESPMSAFSSTATSYNDDSLVENGSLVPVDPTLDPSLDVDLSMLETTLQSAMSQTVPHNQGFDNVYEANPIQKTSATSLPATLTEAQPKKNIGGRQRQGPPPFMTDEEAQMWAKERQKKDNHNVIERRRRFNINDRIQELAGLLPHNLDPYLNLPNRDSRRCKGSILQQSVVYIKRLRRETEQKKQYEERLKNFEATNRKLLLKVQEMEIMMKNHGLNHPVVDSSQELLSEMMRNNEAVKPEPVELSDDLSPIGADPMLSQSSPAISRHSSVSAMDDIQYTQLN